MSKGKGGLVFFNQIGMGETFAEKNAGKAKFCKLDSAGNRRLSISQKVMGLPTLVFYKDGEKAFTFDKDSIEMNAVQAKLDELIG